MGAKPNLHPNECREIIRLYREGKTSKEICKLVNRSYASVNRVLRRNGGYSLYGKFRRSPYSIEIDIENLLRNGVMIEDVCQQLNVSRTKVIEVFKEKFRPTLVKNDSLDEKKRFFKDFLNWAIAEEHWNIAEKTAALLDILDSEKN